MTFCPDDQTNPSLRVVFCARKFLSSGRQRDNKKAFKVLGQKKLITHARHSLLFCAWCLEFCIRGVCGGFWHKPFSAMMVMMTDTYDSAAIGCVLRWTRDYEISQDCVLS